MVQDTIGTEILSNITEISEQEELLEKSSTEKINQDIGEFFLLTNDDINYIEEELKKESGFDLNEFKMEEESVHQHKAVIENMTMAGALKISLFTDEYSQ